MNLPATERGRASLAWKLLERLVRHNEIAASIKPGEPLAWPGTPRRLIQVARMLLDLQAATRSAQPPHPKGGEPR